MLGEYNRFANLMADDILAKLDGSHPEFDRMFFINKPSRSIILGSLSDSKVDMKKSKTSVKNNNMAVKFLLKEFSGDINVKPSFSIYYRVFPTFEEQQKYISSLDDEKTEHRFAPIWKRKIFSGEFISLNEKSNCFPVNLDEFIDEIYNDDLLFTAKSDDLIEDFDSEVEYFDKIKLFNGGKLPDFKWNCEIYLNKSNLVQQDDLFNLIEVGMVNLSEETHNYETFIFDCNLVIDLKEYKLNNFIYSYEENDDVEFYDSQFRTLNCHAYFDEESNEIKTIHYAKHNDKKLEPVNRKKDFEARFDILMSDKCIDCLEELYDLMVDFENNSERGLDNYKSHENFKMSRQNFLEGINALKNNSNALKAFKLMNKSFFKNSKGKYLSWRLFQIVFIVSLIPEIIDKTSEREVCDLLHVMTGGGKSESYFGIVIFTAFYDRITGKKFGVSAWTKFPLRMLSIQQLQRISNLFIWAEEIRIDENILGDPFTVAYFVGNTNNPEFPKNNDLLIEQINNSIDKIPGRIISSCPICGNEVVLTVDDEKSLIMHECLGCHKQFGLFFTDYEIFRVLPTFIISTVDKLAAISSQYRIKNILGGKLDKCSEGHGFIPRNGECLVSNCDCDHIPVDIDFNTGPSIIIQDELHLIKEGFGTINSHFESCYQALSREFSNENYKYVVMTATVNGAAKQIKELYNKDVRIFPPRLVDKNNEEFFFEYYKENGKKICNRQIIGLKPNNVDNNTAIILSLRYISEFIKKVENDENFASRHNFDEKLLTEIIHSYKSILTYHLKVSDVHNTKNYVGRNINDSNFDIYKIDAMTLTGDDSLDKIKEVIKGVESFNQDLNKLQVTSATNIVSHGIDIDKWNLMFFQGIPRSTSEYIQALSRVGRKYHGLIFLWFYPNRVRDLSFYQNFTEYHKILQYKVEKVPIARWTKLGFKQTFTSIFIVGILSFLSDKLEKIIYNREDIIEVLDNEDNKKLLVNFIHEAYLSNSEELGAEFFRDNIEIEIDKRINHLIDYEGPDTFVTNVFEYGNKRYFKVQSGMRGIQDTVNVKRNLPFCYYK